MEAVQARFATIIDKSLRNNGVQLTGAELAIVSKEIGAYVVNNHVDIHKEALAAVEAKKKAEVTPKFEAAPEPAKGKYILKNGEWVLQ